MASIGDIFFSLRGDDKTLQADIVKAGDKAGTSFGSRMSAGLKKSWSGGEIGKGLVQGLGLAGGLGAFALITGAISTFTGAIGDSVKMAMADEESQSRMRASLAANIPGWDGNTAAIERNILSKQRLGFTDEELRASTAVLVGATHDVAKAQDIQNTAMDLARFKHISLADATQALIRVEAGSYRILKSLGIELPKNATQTQALAAVQKVAAGQAEDYAKTNQGKLEASQIRLNEVMEKFGYSVMPAVIGAMTTAAGIAAGFADAITGSTRDQIQALEAEVAQLQQAGASTAQLLDIQARIKALRPDVLFQSEADSLNRSTAAINAMGDAQGGLGDWGALDALEASHAYTKVGDAASTTATRVESTASRIKTAVTNLTAFLLGKVTELINGYYDPIIAQEQLRVDQDTVAADKVALAATKAGTAQRRQAQLTLTQAQQALDQTRSALLASGTLTAKEQATWLTDLRARYKTATGDAKAKILSLISTIEQLQGVNATGTRIIVQGLLPGQHGHAAGGTIQAGEFSWVGERGPELIGPVGYPRTVIPNAQSVAMTSGGGGPGGVTVHVAGLVKAESPEDIARVMRRVSSLGITGL